MNRTVLPLIQDERKKAETVSDLHNDPVSATTRAKRLGVVDRHTLLKGDFATVKSLRNQELILLINRNSETKQLRQAAAVELQHRARTNEVLRVQAEKVIQDPTLKAMFKKKDIDPEDNNTCEI